MQPQHAAFQSFPESMGHTSQSTSPSIETPIPQPARFKTRMCTVVEEGRVCPRGDSCLFAHSPAELRSIEQNLAAGIVTVGRVHAFRRQQRKQRSTPPPPPPQGPALMPVAAAPSAYSYTAHSTLPHVPLDPPFVATMNGSYVLAFAGTPPVSPAHGPSPSGWAPHALPGHHAAYTVATTSGDSHVPFAYGSMAPAPAQWYPSTAMPPYVADGHHGASAGDCPPPTGPIVYAQVWPPMN